MTQAPFDVQRAHRWFAVELNNRAWELIEAPTRTEKQLREMIHAAHASCYHWLVAGNLLNELRGEHLLSTAYAKAGRHEAALRHAQRALALTQEAGDEAGAFDHACTHGCAAVALALSNQAQDSQYHLTRMRDAMQKLPDQREQNVIQQLYVDRLNELTGQDEAD